TIVGEEGDLFQATKNLEIRKNVVLTSSDGMRLETSVLRWQGAEKRLWTDAPVRLSRGGAVADGSALEVRMAEEYTTMAGRVHSVFTDARRGGRPRSSSPCCWSSRPHCRAGRLR